MHFLLGKNSRSPAPLCNLHLPFHFSPAPHASPSQSRGTTESYFFYHLFPPPTPNLPLPFLPPPCILPAFGTVWLCTLPSTPLSWHVGTAWLCFPSEALLPCVEHFLMKLSPPQPTHHCPGTRPFATQVRNDTVQWCGKALSSPKSSPGTVTRVPWLGWVNGAQGLSPWEQVLRSVPCTRHQHRHRHQHCHTPSWGSEGPSALWGAPATPRPHAQLPRVLAWALVWQSPFCHALGIPRRARVAFCPQTLSLTFPCSPSSWPQTPHRPPPRLRHAARPSCAWRCARGAPWACCSSVLASPRSWGCSRCPFGSR